ncbi:MAG: undecaprenyl-phosphate glucose phosphotransferase [bacterium]|nr:undecaprenyl-phosphate glucose phosphotransferase [bacterium]
MRKRNPAQAVAAQDRYFLPALILASADFAVFFGMFLLAFLIRYYSPFASLVPADHSIPAIHPYVTLALCIALMGFVVFERIGLYARRVGLDRKVWTVTLILATLVNYIFIMAILFNYRGYSFSRLTVAMAIPLTAIGVVVVHGLLKQAQFYLIQRGVVFQKTAIIGPLNLCADAEQRLRDHYGSQFQVLGYITTQDAPSRLNETFSESDGVTLLGARGQLSSILRENPIDCVMVAMDSGDHREILNVMNECRRLGVTYRLSPELYDMLAQRVPIDEFEELPTLLFGESPLAGAGEFAKRSVDIMISMAALLVASPIMAFIALLIRFDTKGSVFYVQERVGNDGRRFYIYKFRSMVDEAEKESGPIWATANDPRTTVVGRFLRKYNLDELPQFYNVLRGDMSVVGPRPERPYFVNKFKNEIPQYMRRHLVKSGITGWAQVNGWRGDTSVLERTNHDLYYVKNWSLLLDLQIMLKTLVSFKNAY